MNDVDVAELLSRLRALEARVAGLEFTAVSATEGAAEADRTPEVDPGKDPLWAVSGVRTATAGAGGILYAGDVPETANGAAVWQYARPMPYIEKLDFTAAAQSLDALGNPVRLALMQEIHRGTTTVAGLSELGTFGTTGQIYHHLQLLASAGWLESPKRGQWTIPAARLVPFLTIVLAVIG